MFGMTIGHLEQKISLKSLLVSNNSCIFAKIFKTKGNGKGKGIGTGGRTVTACRK